MNLVTVITPTYNRAYTLPHLYQSLCSQTLKNFEWLVVDDGSADNTEELMQKFVEEKKIPVRYLRKENGGKHKALNFGIKTVVSPLTFIVDSDDALLPNATAEIEKIYQKYREDTSIGVLSFLKCYQNGKPVIAMETDEFTDTYANYRIRGNHPGDMAEVFLTSILRDNPFPEFEGERFLSEDIEWIELSKNYRTVFVNNPIYECEYLEDGLTRNDKPMKFASPLGSMLRGKKRMESFCGLRENIRGAIIYNCYHHEVKKELPEILHLTVREKVLVALTKPLGMLFYKKWKPKDK